MRCLRMGSLIPYKIQSRTYRIPAGIRNKNTRDWQFKDWHRTKGWIFSFRNLRFFEEKGLLYQNFTETLPQGCRKFTLSPCSKLLAMLLYRCQTITGKLHCHLVANIRQRCCNVAIGLPECLTLRQQRCCNMVAFKWFCNSLATSRQRCYNVVTRLPKRYFVTLQDYNKAISDKPYSSDATNSELCNKLLATSLHLFNK